LATRERLVSAMIGIMLMCGQAHAQAPAPGAAKGHISLARIEALFDDLKASGRDPNGDLPWCYFFIGYDRAKLDAAAKILVTQGYAVVGVQSQPNALPDGPPVWQLEMRRVERLTPEGLFARTEAFYALAGQIGSVRYDGLGVDSAQ
jgi:hypothetical protein